MRTLMTASVGVLSAALASAAPIRPPRVPDDPPLVGQTLAVEMNAAGALVVPGREPMTKTQDVKAFLNAQVARIKKVAASSNEDFAPGLALRTSSAAAYRQLVDLLDEARHAGFLDVRVEATSKR